MRGLGWPELVIILVIVIVLFGSSRLPIIARSIGASAKEFRRGMADGTGETADDETSDGDS
jgi:sec-independent protein translocase protein TatA